MPHLLVIDDELNIRNLLKLMLEREGFTVSLAENGSEGIKMYRQHQYDVIITDLLMPEKEGLETIIELKREDPGLKIIAISGGTSEGTMDFLKSARLLGADAALPKPFDQETLVRTVNDVLNQT